MASYGFPVFGTQGGGLVKETASGVFVFVEEPIGSGLKVGDKMPSEWSIVPANQRARDLMEDELWGKPMTMSEILRVVASHPDFE